MAFKPHGSDRPQSQFEDSSKLPVPRKGSRKARVSLIVDLGIQERPDFEEKDGTKKPQKPAHQVAVFADLTHDKVDYGGKIGEQHYRLMLNSEFMGKVEGITFQAGPVRDTQGEAIQGRAWELHPLSPLTKLAKAVGKPDVIVSQDIEQLLGLPFMAQVEIKETQAKGDKKDKDGNPLVYRNVRYKGPAEVPEDDDGNPQPVNELNTPALCIQFTNAKKEDIKFVRKSLIAKIKTAQNYAGSKMQAAIEAYEEETGAETPAEEQEEQPEEKATTPAKKPAAKPAANKKAEPKKEADEEEFEDAPF